MSRLVQFLKDYQLWNGGEQASFDDATALSLINRGIAADRGILTPALPGTCYYVHPSGNDSAGGSLSSPFATLQHAVDVANAGDQIFVYPGTYEENLVVDKDDISLISLYPMGRGVTTKFRPIIEGGADPALDLTKCYRFRLVGFYAHSTGAKAVLTNCEGACFENCELDADGGAAVIFQSSADDNIFTGSGTFFDRCIFDGSVNGIKVMHHTGDSEGCATNVVLKDCQFYGNSGADIADEGVASYDYFNSWLIKDCDFQDEDKAVHLAMKAAGAGETHMAIISGCNFNASAAADSTQFAIPSGCRVVGCYNSRGVIDSHTF